MKDKEKIQTHTTRIHKYPTRKNIENSKICETNYIFHKNNTKTKINRLSNRVSKLQGFLQHAEAQSVWDADTQKMMEYKDLINKGPESNTKWNTSYANELGRLSNGIRDIKGTQTVNFISHTQVPNNKRVTYGRLVVDYRPGKSDPNRTRLTVGGNLLTFDGDLYTETVDIITMKLLFNSVLSTPNAKFMCIDITKFYLGTPIKSMSI